MIWLERGLLVIIVLMIVTTLSRQSVSTSSKKFSLSSKVTPTGFESRSKQLGKHCLNGKPDFESLIKKKCYVDKTGYIDKLIEEINNPFFFLARPRRFGKTLLVDTMEKFFRRNGRKKLFENTEIYQRRPDGWKRYPTIRLDFSSGISSQTAYSFNVSLTEEIQAQAKKRNINLTKTTIEGMTKEFIQLLSEKTKSPVVILVDEYDSPYTRCYANRKDEAHKILEILQGFYSTIKGEYKNIHFCFVTGITRLALSDFFSGFNAAVDLTMDPEYAGIVGFNEIELHEYFGNEIKRVASETGKEKKEILEAMKSWHDGFQFTSKYETLYSPCSVYSYLRTNAVSTTGWSDSGGPSSFLIAKLKEFPAQALKFLVDHLTNRKVDKKEDETPKVIANRKELTGKIDFGKFDERALIAFLYHNGYFSIREYNKASDSFSLNFTNLELEEDYQQRLASGYFEQFEEGLIKKIELMVDDLIAYKWEDFCELLRSCNAAIPYQITTNQHEAKEAWFQFSLFLMLSHSHNVKREILAIEDSTNMGLADIVFVNNVAVFIFEPKMEDNPENPMYECKEKYIQKYLFESKRKVFCIGLKFTMEGSIHSWGVASFSYGGRLVKEDGTLTLTNQLSPKEREDIRVKMTDYAEKHPECTLVPEKLCEFLEGVGPSTEGQIVFAEKFSQNILTLRGVLEEIYKLFQGTSNFKGIIFSFLKATKRFKENSVIEKLVNSDSDDLFYLTKKFFVPVQKALFADKSNKFSISFEDFVRFIHDCEEANEAFSIASKYTQDFPKLQILLNETYPLIKNKLLKNQITRIQTALNKNTSIKKN